ncbi:unnamed protein product [Caretta caretta]
MGQHQMLLRKDRSNFVYMTCKLVSILEEKIKGLETQVSTLRCVRENEDFLDRSQRLVLQAQQAEESERAVQNGEENWQHVTSRRRKRRTHVLPMQIEELSSYTIIYKLYIYQLQMPQPQNHVTKERTKNVSAKTQNRPVRFGMSGVYVCVCCCWFFCMCMVISLPIRMIGEKSLQRISSKGFPPP